MASDSIFKNGSVAALGNFDGLHRGHMAVINAAADMAERIGAVPCIITFSEHSLKVLKGKAPSELFCGEVKRRAFENTGAAVQALDFMKIKDMSAEDFVRRVLIDTFNARGVCCGYNYHFGRNADGNCGKLRELCTKYGLELSVSPPMEYRGEPISSTRIRGLLEQGEVEQVNDMLGRAFSYKEVVIDGDKRGRLLGTPTINQIIDCNMTVPKYGVYATAAKIGGRLYPSVTNIGIRPTIGTGVLGSETYIIGYSGNLYGESVEIFLIKYLRGEIKFDSLEALRDRILFDAETAKTIFNEHENSGIM